MDDKTVHTYIAISFGIILPVSAAVLLMNRFVLPVYGTVLGAMAIAVGGISTTVAGIVAARRSGKMKHSTELLRDFFALRQPIRNYAIMLVFLLLTFGHRIISSQWQEGRSYLSVPGLFLVAILFGGIEEIGWRYLFQPTLEKKLSFALASSVTFGLWGLWHILYFAADGSIWQMTPSGLLLFLWGLLGNTFILGAIYRITQSLWICVCYHALLNALTQALVPTGAMGALIVAMLCVALSIVLVRVTDNR